MKRLLLFFVITSFAGTSFGQCNIGNDMDLGSSSSHSPNYLLGSSINITSSFYLTEMGMIAMQAGNNFKVAVYDDIGGNPGNLITEGAGTTVVGVNIIDVPDMALPAGTYYYMAVFETNASISYTTGTGATVYYISHTYSSALPISFGAPTTYTDQEFSYYLIGSGSSGTDVISACDSYTWIDGNSYTANNNSATFNVVGGATNGCDSIVTLDLTINTSSSSSITETGLDVYTAPSGATYTTSGIYNDTIPNAAGCDSVITIDLTMNYTGLNEYQIGSINVYPNPSSDNVTISISENLLGNSIMVIDQAGRVVIESYAYEINTKLNIAKLENGLYYIKIGELKSMKLIKQ